MKNKFKLQYEDDLLRRLDKLKKRHELDMPLIKQAIKWAKHYHSEQFRHSGEPFYSHPIEVAKIVLDYSCNTNVIIAAILHDVVEDTNLIEEAISIVFNRDIFNKVMALTTLRNNVKLDAHNKLYSLYQSYDKEIILIKLCDRLHNMRTIAHKPPHKQHVIALQTLQTFVPLAKYMNVPKIEQELSEICSSILLKSK